MIDVAARAASESAVAVDSRAEISRVIQQYAQALESKDIARVRSVFPSISAEQASQLEDSFESMRDLTVVLTVDRLDVRKSKISNAGLDRLELALPKTKVLRRPDNDSPTVN